MAELKVQLIRPDRLLYEGPVASVILATHAGELGVWPGRSPLICALGDGAVRLNLLERDGGGTERVIVSGGYAEVENDTVTILADYARLIDDIDRVKTEKLISEAKTKLADIDADDSRRAYWENKVSWLSLLLRYAPAAREGG